MKSHNMVEFAKRCRLEGDVRKDVLSEYYFEKFEEMPPLELSVGELSHKIGIPTRDERLDK